MKSSYDSTSDHHRESLSWYDSNGISGNHSEQCSYSTGLFSRHPPQLTSKDGEFDSQSCYPPSLLLQATKKSSAYPNGYRPRLRSISESFVGEEAPPVDNTIRIPRLELSLAMKLDTMNPEKNQALQPAVALPGISSPISKPGPCSSKPPNCPPPLSMESEMWLPGIQSPVAGKPFSNEGSPDGSPRREKIGQNNSGSPTHTRRARHGLAKIPPLMCDELESPSSLANANFHLASLKETCAGGSPLALGQLAPLPPAHFVSPTRDNRTFQVPSCPEDEAISESSSSLGELMSSSNLNSPLQKAPQPKMLVGSSARVDGSPAFPISTVAPNQIFGLSDRTSPSTLSKNDSSPNPNFTSIMTKEPTGAILGNPVPFLNIGAFQNLHQPSMQKKSPLEGTGLSRVSAASPLGAGSPRSRSIVSFSQNVKDAPHSPLADVRLEAVHHHLDSLPLPVLSSPTPSRKNGKVAPL